MAIVNAPRTARAAAAAALVVLAACQAQTGAGSSVPTPPVETTSLPDSARAFADGTVYPQGPEPRLPYAVGSTLHLDGAEVDVGQALNDLARTGIPGTLVARGDAVTGASEQVLLLDRSGARRIGTIDGRTLAASPTSSLIAWASSSWTSRGQDRDTTVEVVDAASGETVATRGFAFGEVVAVDGDRVLLEEGRADARLVWWRPSDGSVEHLVAGNFAIADPGADRLQYYDADSQRLTTSLLRDPGRVLYTGDIGLTSCVQDWSGSGRALLTYCEVDSADLAATRVVGTEGQATGTIEYRTRDAVWESDDAFLVVRLDEETVQVLRCDPTASCTGAGEAYAVRTFEEIPAFGYSVAPLVELAR
ncbi:hypothetical protein KLP28_06085 [Nocardioidaceae bacterium]|nr:hypothetical protein KLP28_06085 [Nocardioidaceae bacterium]